MAKTYKSNKIKIHCSREWSDISVNICNGCSHDCLYCREKARAHRFKQVPRSEWPQERLRQKDVNKNYPKYKIDGMVMFPSTHDITPAILPEYLTVLKKLLKAGNRVLIVSKPHFECITEICTKMKAYRQQILFRFTIGACDDGVLSFWEPNAPKYAERKACLEYAFKAEFDTSVSVEPMLDAAHIDDLVEDLLPFVTDAIWLGKMNMIRQNVLETTPEMEAAIQAIEASQTNMAIKAIYERHSSNPKIKWRERFKRIVGIPLSTKPGMDM